jgi:hypothetical protein
VVEEGTMWPYLFGSGWIWDALLSAGFLALVVAAIAVLLGEADQTAERRGGARDRLQHTWHRYEEGDLTAWEFARLVSSRPFVQYCATGRGNHTAAHRAPVH